MAALAWVESVAERAEQRPEWLAWLGPARSGDRAAFARLHQHFKGLVHAVIVAKVAPGDAGDLTQDVFVLMLARLPTLKDDRAFPAWLMSLARTRALSHLRDRPRHEPLDPDVPLAAADHSAAPDARKIVAALQRLPEAYAETLAMRLIEGLSGPEISERTGLTPGSVRVNLHRGMTLLREALGVRGAGRGEPA